MGDILKTVKPKSEEELERLEGSERVKQTKNDKTN